MAEDKGFDDQDSDSTFIDFGDVEEASFEVLPKGNYDVTIEDCEFKYSASGGNPMWSLSLVVNGGDYDGRKLFSHVVFSPKAMPFAKKTLSRIAPELLQSAFDAQDTNIINSMIGKSCRAKVDVRKYEGEDTNNVRDLLPAGGEGDGFMP